MKSKIPILVTKEILLIVALLLLEKGVQSAEVRLLIEDKLY